jgi:DNA-binding PadR family transcriptional regulator
LARPKGSIGETKLRVLAILYLNEEKGDTSYGYAVWKELSRKYETCLGEDGLRNVYHHLEGLLDSELVSRSAVQPSPRAPQRHLYGLTVKGRSLFTKYERYVT